MGNVQPGAVLEIVSPIACEDKQAAKTRAGVLIAMETITLAVLIAAVVVTGLLVPKLAGDDGGKRTLNAAGLALAVVAAIINVVVLGMQSAAFADLTAPIDIVL